MTKARQLTAYEKNQLKKNGHNPEDLSLLKDLGEMPVEYFLGKVEFCNNVFEVSQDTLIPRVETEELVKLVADDIKSDSIVGDLNLAEVGTGSGAIGLSIAKSLEKLEIPYKLALTDISSKALEVAKKNHQTLFFGKNLVGEIAFLESNLLASFPKTALLDCIIANLPYIPESRIRNLPTSVKDFEPRLALVGGVDGFDLIRELIAQAENLLKPKGKIYLEVDDTHTEDFFREYEEKWQIQHIRDQFEKNRFVVMQLKD